MKSASPGHSAANSPPTTCGRFGRWGWAGKKYGELLALMAAGGFEVLLTVDRNLRHQQNLSAAGVVVVVVVAATNRLPDLIPVVPAVEVALATVKPGDAVEVRI